MPGWCQSAGKKDNLEYLSVEQTQAVKGFFIILVFFSHFRSYVSLINRWDIFIADLIGGFGQAMVSMFLFYSGYGVMESIRRKGRVYIADIPRKRILMTLIRFDCAVLLFAVLGLWTGEEITPTRFFTSLTGWDSLGNSNWYIFAILVLYAITYLAFSVSGTENLSGGILLTFLATLAYIAVLFLWDIKPMHWYDTVLCYVLGMAWSQWGRAKAEPLLRKPLLWGISLAGMLAALHLFSVIEYTAPNQILRNPAFTVCVILVTMRVSNHSRVLAWCGKHLFALYILQRVPMIALKHIGLERFSITMYLLCCVVGTVILIYPFEYVTDLLCSCIKRK